MSGLVQPHERSVYMARKTAEPALCTRCGEEPPTEDSLLGAWCLERERQRVRRAVRRLRRRRKAERRCRSCGRPSDEYRCPACKIKRGQIPTTGCNGGGNQSATPDRWRRDNDGWERFRGKGRRGNPSAELKDEADLDEIAKLVERAREAYRYARSKAVAEQGRITKQATLDEADAIVALLARFADEILTRHGK